MGARSLPAFRPSAPGPSPRSATGLFVLGTRVCHQHTPLHSTSLLYDLNLLILFAFLCCFSSNYLRSFDYITKLPQRELSLLFPAQPKIFNMVDQKLPKELGEKVNVNCKATGNPTPSVKWVRKTADGRHTPVTQWDGKSHTLQINSLLEEHYGDYMCLAENKFGNDTVVLSLGKCDYLRMRSCRCSHGGLTSFGFEPWSMSPC